MRKLWPATATVSGALLALIAALSPAALAADLTVPAAIAADSTAPAVVVELSSNGNGGSAVDTTLFGETILVPGRHESATMLVRNVGADDGRIVATITDADLRYSDDGYRAFDYIYVEVSNGKSGITAITTAADLADGHLPVYEGYLRAGEQIPLTFDLVWLPPAELENTFNTPVNRNEMTFNVDLRLSAPGFGSGNSVTNPISQLTRTGFPLWPLIVGSAGILGGAGVLTQRKRDNGPK